MEDTKEPPELVNTGTPSQSLSEKLAPSPELSSNKADTKLETDIDETPDLSGIDSDVYPNLLTKVFVGIGLALAVFLVFYPLNFPFAKMLTVGRWDSIKRLWQPQFPKLTQR